MSEIADLFFKPKINRGFFYGGGFQNPTCEETIEVHNPATAELFTRVSVAGKDDVTAAVRAARAGFEIWSKIDPIDRARHLRKFADVIEKNIPNLALLETEVTGRSIKEMHAQMARIPEWVEYFAGIAMGLEGESNVVKGGYVTMTHYEPLGPVALLTPWNHPVLILVKKMAAALAAGNTCVIKPSELAPVSSLVLAALATEAGLPAGVVNVVTGGPVTGMELCGAEDIHYIDLTGGTETGRKVAAQAGERLIRSTMELGGKTSIIICEDADFDGAIAGALFSAFVASGQTCVSGSRFIVHSSIYDRFTDALAVRADAIVIGDPMAEITQMGPVISKASQVRCLRMIGKAKADGAVQIAGLTSPDLTAPFDKGFYIRPTIFKDVQSDHELFLEEVFGPVISMTPYTTEAEALELANTGNFGLGLSIWSRDIARAHRLSLGVRGGVVWLNDHHRNDPRSVWGGVRDSGFGKENGWDALKAYTTKKSVVVRTAPGYDDWFAGSTRYG
ncbi:MAG: aldehyde dehydrogenase family protein [Tateyamaria sp.]|nr:aldehyde dehydrogenase family protein [Tateyamaria sp.]